MSIRWWWGPLCTRPKHFNVGIFIVLAHWNNSPRIDMLPHSDTLGNKNTDWSINVNVSLNDEWPTTIIINTIQKEDRFVVGTSGQNSLCSEFVNCIVTKFVQQFHPSKIKHFTWYTTSNGPRYQNTELLRASIGGGYGCPIDWEVSGYDTESITVDTLLTMGYGHPLDFVSYVPYNFYSFYICHICY